MEVGIEHGAEAVDEGHRPKRASAGAPGLWVLSRFSIACKDPAEAFRSMPAIRIEATNQKD
jgi:hypothetical protein